MLDRFPLRVIIVDHHPSFWQAARWALDQDGRFEVVAEVNRTAEAGEYLERERVDLAVVGLRLPGANGIETVRQLRLNYPHLLIILIASDLPAEYRRQAGQAGVNACLVKDEFSPAALLQGLVWPGVG